MDKETVRIHIHEKIVSAEGVSYIAEAWGSSYEDVKDGVLLFEYLKGDVLADDLGKDPNFKLPLPIERKGLEAEYSTLLVFRSSEGKSY